MSDYFLDSFLEWQRRFKCPTCNGKSLDFTITEKINEPIICTKCGSHFNIINTIKNNGV